MNKGESKARKRRARARVCEKARLKQCTRMSTNKIKEKLIPSGGEGGKKEEEGIVGGESSEWSGMSRGKTCDLWV